MSVKRLRKELEIVRRAVQPKATGDTELQVLLKKLDAIQQTDPDQLKVAAKAVARDYAEGRIK
jgi:hypothetical protein